MIGISFDPGVTGFRIRRCSLSLISKEKHGRQYCIGIFKNFIPPRLMPITRFVFLQTNQWHRNNHAHCLFHLTVSFQSDQAGSNKHVPIINSHPTSCPYFISIFTQSYYESGDGFIYANHSIKRIEKITCQILAAKIETNGDQ